MSILKIQKNIIFVFYFIIFINSKIVFPFKEIEINNTTLSEDDPNDLYNQIYLYNIYTMIKIGKPEQTIIATFNSEKSNLIVKDIPKLYNIEGHNTYNYASSYTFKNITTQNTDEIISRGYSIINETLTLSKNEDRTHLIEITDFQFELFNHFDYKNETKTLSGEIGFKNDDSKLSFIKQLLNKKIIDSNIISFNYTSDNEGYIYLGEYLDNYENYNESNNIKTINISNIYDGSLFQIEIDYAYIKYNNGRTFFSDTNLIFYLEQGIILASDGYQMSINEIFFKKQIEDKKKKKKQISFGIDD